MRIVLTNDDGIDAPGLVAARRALEEIGDVLVVAPDQNRSGVGRSISFGRPLHVEERELADGGRGYACSGTPVDCVRLVALGLLDFQPDVVVSGINHGENLGDDITYSGTVAGALEGIVIGVPGIAASLSIDRPWHETADEASMVDHPLHFEPVARFVARLTKRALHALPEGRILSVNAPNLPADRVRGARVTRLGRRLYRDELIEVRDDEGRLGYNIYNNPPDRHVEEGTDFAAVENGEISVTPIHLELTDAAGIEEISTWNVEDLLGENLWVQNGSPKAVLFDFDGTLVDTTDLIYNSLLRATGDVLGREFSREELLSGVGRPLPRQMEALVGEDPDRTVLVERLMESYREHNERLHEHLISEFPGVEAALARLHAAGVRTAVVTSKRRRSVEMALDSFPGLRNVTDVFVTMEDTERHKPDPAPLLKGLELLGGVPIDRAAYVGDSPHDVKAARDAGVMSVAVSWGAFSEEALRRAEPDHLVGDMDAVVDVLLGTEHR